MRTIHRYIELAAAWLLTATFAASGACDKPKSDLASGDRRSDRPNVLFIAVDDLNDWVGALGGHPDGRTPNLDRLANRGMLFTRAYCAAPACNPSRVALLTGLRPSQTGVYHNNQPWRPVLVRAVTLPQHFMAHGYRVVGGGKIFHNAFNDLACWHEYHRRPGDPVPPSLPANGIANTGHFDWGPLDADDGDMGDAKLVDWACEFLSQSGERPFFLAVGLIKPHLPWFAPRKHFESFPTEKVRLPLVRDDDLADIPEPGLRMARPDGDHRRVVQSGNWRSAVQAYLATISFVDGQIGRLIDALGRSPHASNTIIVLWSDHGWHLGEKQHWRKFALWEEATRVVLIVCAPGMTQPGRRCARTVSLLDLYPTLSELCGLPSGKQLHGDSLVALLKDPNAEWDRPVVTTHGRGNHAVRSERWRYIRYADGSEELYDHENDPSEWTNLAGRQQFDDIKTRLRQALPGHDAQDAPSGKRAASTRTQTARPGDPLQEQAQWALLRAVTFFRNQASAHGGYVYRYSADLSRCEGEGKAGPETVWVQPPGTPSVGMAYLDAYERTGQTYLLEAAKAAGECLIRGQLRSGGWTASIEFDPKARTRFAYRVDPPRKRSFNWSSFDDDKSQSAMRFLMRLDQSLGFKDVRVHEAITFALDRVLEAQFPNGGWPQAFESPPQASKHPVKRAGFPDTWPRKHPGGDYWIYYTFNDNAIADTIDMLFLAAGIYRSERYLRAAIRGGEFILLAQMPDPQPAWAQQYDFEMHPVWARRFEPPAVSGGESQGILECLLRVYRQTGDRRFLEPVPRALAYLRRSQLVDGRLARFYELQSNRPLYCTRTYELTYEDRDLPTHYGFKVSSRLDQIARDYERLSRQSPAEIAAERSKRTTDRRPSTISESQVRSIVAALDERGAWVEEGRLRYHGQDDATRRVIDSATFIRNVDILSRYLGGLASASNDRE